MRLASNKPAERSPASRTVGLKATFISVRACSSTTEIRRLQRICCAIDVSGAFMPHSPQLEPDRAAEAGAPQERHERINPVGTINVVPVSIISAGPATSWPTSSASRSKARPSTRAAPSAQSSTSCAVRGQRLRLSCGCQGCALQKLTSARAVHPRISTSLREARAHTNDGSGARRLRGYGGLALPPQGWQDQAAP